MNRRARLPLRSLALAASAVAVAAAPASFDDLVWTREGILHGELWRIPTGHLVHASPAHLAWDAIALVLIGVLFEEALGKRYWRVVLASSLAVGSGLLVLAPDLDAYCGLSGILNGIWVAGALLAARAEEAEGRKALALLYRFCVAAALTKVTLEGMTGIPLFTSGADLGGVPVPLSHALGALGGVAGLSAEAETEADPEGGIHLGDPLRGEGAGLLEEAPLVQGEDLREAREPG